MTNSKQHSWLRRALRPTPKRLAMLLALAALWGVYLAYFTPQKRAVRHHLSETDTKAKAALDQRMKPLADLFAHGRGGARNFSEESLSWSGKWALVKGFVGGSDDHRRYLDEAFARHIFTPEQLQKAIESTVRGYLDDVEGFENEMLVQLRADLADPERGIESIPHHLRGDEAFREEYRKLSAQILSELQQDLGVEAGRQIGVVIASDIATNIALQAARAAAAELGISSGILGVGAASSVATLGVGLVVGVIIDYILDQVFKMAGYDPADKIRSLVVDSLNKMEDALTRDPGFFSSDKKGTLRQRLEELHEQRSRLRRETIERLVKEGGLR